MGYLDKMFNKRNQQGRDIFNNFFNSREKDIQLQFLE